MNKGFESVICILPERIKNALSSQVFDMIEEIRIRVDAPVYIYGNNKEFYLYESDRMLYAAKDDINFILQKATCNSLYTYTEDIKNGFITIKDGHRIGVCGRAVYENGKLINIKDISALNIRCASEIKGVGSEIAKRIYDSGILKNTLIVAPPKCGKTTVLRDVARILSLNKGMKTVVIDERDEIAAGFMGKNSNDVGERTFVMSGYLKKEGFSHAVRGMAPTLIICDEIGNEEDYKIIKDALLRGVKIVATLHGNSEKDLPDECYKLFEQIVYLNKNFESTIIETGDKS